MLILIGDCRRPRASRFERFHPTVAATLRLPAPSAPKPGYLLQPDISDAIDVFDPVPLQDVTPSDIRAGS